MSSGFIEKTDLHYIAMDKLGPSIMDLLFEIPDRVLSLKTTIQIGVQMLERLEALHSAGYLHLDLKPHNIVLMSKNLSSDKSSTLCLIDFGISQTYLKKNGSHKY